MANIFQGPESSRGSVECLTGANTSAHASARSDFATNGKRRSSTELAEHLEDQCAARAEKAILPQNRVEPIEGGTDWNLLAREIRHAEEETMSPTAKTLWVPGVSMLFCSFILLFAMTRLVPPAIWVNPKAPVLLMAPWLLSYLVFGALGAWWSRRAGGSRATRFFSGIFPLALHLAASLAGHSRDSLECSTFWGTRPSELSVANRPRMGRDSGSCPGHRHSPVPARLRECLTSANSSAHG